MIKRKDLQDAITAVENDRECMQNCYKLATLYTMYDHLYPEAAKSESIQEEKIVDYGDSEFLKAIKGKDPGDVWLLMDELMSTIQILQPKLYESVIRRLKS